MRGTRRCRGGEYTPHSPKNLFPTAENQISFDQRELNIIGHWSSSAKMPERYDRSACAAELLLRNTIVRRVRTGRGVAPAFHLPETVTGASRIGRNAQSEVASDTSELMLEGLKMPHPTQGNPTDRDESSTQDEPTPTIIEPLKNESQNLKSTRAGVWHWSLTGVGPPPLPHP